MVYALPEWYRQKRRSFEEMFFAVADELHAIRNHQQLSTSPSGKYTLDITVYSTGPDASTPSWKFSRGVVRQISDGEILADIKRDFGHFPFAWVNQKDREYLVCGEDYQGYSVVDLVEGKTDVFIPEAAETGGGFCWAEIEPSPGGAYLLVEGCYWAADFELRLYDFSAPSELPIPEAAGLSYLYGDPYKDSIHLDGRWIDDNHIELEANVHTEESQTWEKSKDVWTLGEIFSRVSTTRLSRNLHRP